MRKAVLLALSLAALIGVAIPGFHAVQTRRHRQAQCAANRTDQRAGSGVLPGQGSAVILGDSLAAGVRLPDHRQSWAWQLAEAEHWNAHIDAVPSTGYLARGLCTDERFARRISAIPAATQMVVLEGGLNDLGSVPQLQRAAEATIADVHQQAPKATVLVVGIPPTPRRGDAALANAALSAAARDAGATFIAVQNIETGPDGLHPTVAGTSALADQVEHVTR